MTLSPELAALRLQIDHLQASSQGLAPSPEVWQQWWQEIGRFAQQWLGDQDSEAAYYDLRVHPAPKPLSIPQSARPLDEVLTNFRAGLNAGINPCSGRFFGYVPGGGLPAAAVGDFLAALTNRYAGVYRASPVATLIENQLIQWLCDGFRLPTTAWGTLTSGGTMATATCLAAARETRDTADTSKLVVYHSPEAHQALFKALKFVGLGHIQRREVASDTQLRLDPTALDAQMRADQAAGLDPWLIYASFGTVNTGAIDPISELRVISKRFQAWLHVDGAYGGMFAMTASKQAAADCLRDVDSLVVDPHKGLFLPYGCGAALVHDRQWLTKAFRHTAAYLADVEDPNVPSPADVSPELTRHFRGMRLWLSLQLHGSETFKQTLEEKLLLAQYLYARLAEDPRFERGPAPQLSCVTFRVADGASNGASATGDPTLDLLHRLLMRGRVHVSSTTLHGQTYLRACILSFRSHVAEVDSLRSELGTLVGQH